LDKVDIYKKEQGSVDMPSEEMVEYSEEVSQVKPILEQNEKQKYANANVTDMFADMYSSLKLAMLSRK
jgi:hypothetical protein